MLSQPFPSTRPLTTPWSRLKLGLSIGSGRLRLVRGRLGMWRGGGNEAKEEARLAQSIAVAVGDAKVLAKDKLARVQDTLAVAKEAR